MSIRPAVDTLREIRRGEMLDELAEHLAALVLACDRTGKPGALTVTLKLKPGRSGQVEIDDDIAVKAPKLSKGTTLMFGTPEGNLQREDPRQQQLPGLRQVSGAPAEPMREVS